MQKIMKLGVVSAVVASVFLMGGSAFAVGPTDGPSLVTSAQDNLTTVLIPAIAALIGVGVLFWLAVKYFRRGTKTV